MLCLAFLQRLYLDVEVFGLIQDIVFCSPHRPRTFYYVTSFSLLCHCNQRMATVLKWTVKSLGQVKYIFSPGRVTPVEHFLFLSWKK